MGSPASPTEGKLTHAQWAQVVIVAGIGTVLEWFDFYVYIALNSTLEKVFFPTKDPTVQALSYWAVYALAFVMRPLGAIIFGHIGDTYGRNRCLLVSILIMAASTACIGVLPTFNVPPYQAGMAAPVLLAVLRLLQGLAMGGEFGSAVIYVSELAHPSKRGKLVALLQTSVNCGMILATLLAMLLQRTISEDAMLAWGWRVPFLCAFATALLGAALRRRMPEPHTFLEAARKAREAAAAGGEGDLDVEVAEGDAGSEKGAAPAAAAAAAAAAKRGALERLQSNANVRTPILRVVRNNSLGLLFHLCFMAWVSAAFYTTVSWLAKELRTTHKYALLDTQGVMIVSLIPNAVGLLLLGAAIDAGAPALATNAVLVAIGSGLGFALFMGVGKSLAAAYGLTCMFHLFVGAAMANVALPCTRIYEPLQRTTGFSLVYNTGYGVIGGLSPLAVAAIKTGLPAAHAALAPALWLLSLGAVSLVGCGALALYMPRLAKPFVGKLD